MNNNENSLLYLVTKPSKVGMLASYLLIYTIASSIIMLVIATIVGEKYGVSNMEIISCLAGTLDREECLIPSSITNAFTMFFTYGLLIITVCFYARNFLVKDFREIKKSPWRSLILAVVLAGVFYGLSYGIEWLISLGIGEQTSENQKQIVDMFKYGSATFSFITVVVFAPLVEELIYRKLIFETFNRWSIILSYVVSTVLFGMMHMISTTNADVKTFFLLSVSYFSAGALLCGVYHISKQNVWISTFAHILNNLIAAIIIIQQM